MANSIKQQLAADFEKVKTQSGDRVQRIKTIVKTAVSDAITEVKDGTQEVKNTSQASISSVINTVAPKEAADSVVTVAAIEEGGAVDAVAVGSDDMADGMVDDLSTDDVVADMADASAQATVETSMMDIVQRLLKAAGLKAKSTATQQYDKLKEQLPEHYEQLQTKAHGWDEQLVQRYGDDYVGIKQRWEKAVIWYKTKLEEGKATNAHPFEQKQTKKAEKMSDLGVKVAQKEEAVKQQIGQVLRTITVDAQS